MHSQFFHCKARERAFLQIAVLLLAVAALHSSAFAQTAFGSVSGAVTDPSGAAIPNVHITLTNTQTSVTRTTSSKENGLYTFVNLSPGQYKLGADKQGFKHFIRTPVVVRIASATRINISLALGSITQTVAVSAATPQLEPETSSLGQVISGRQVTEMPLNGRNVFNLMALVPSVVPQGSAVGTPVGVNSAAWNNYQINGGFAGQSIVYVDGAPGNVTLHNNDAFIPSQDFVQEFKVQTSNLGPEWGRFSGGVMNLETKSGTNALHGTAYEYLRNKVLNASDFFSNAKGIARPPFTQNQFGANAGGPVYIPHLYNGKNKTFWFAGWEGFRLRQGSTFVTTVPTQAERKGDFSGLRNSSGALIPIYNPYTVCGVSGNAPCMSGANGQPTYQRMPFAGNVIPPTDLSPAAMKMEALWALPNTAGNPATNVNNYIANASSGGNLDTAIGRIDQTIGDNQQLFVRFIYWSNSNVPVDPMHTGVCIDHCYNPYTSYDTVIGDSYTFSPNVVASLHASHLRYNYIRQPINTNYDLTSLGWPSFMNTEIPASLRTPPTPVVAGMASEIFNTQGESVIIGHMDVYDLAPNVTMNIGTHTISAGGQVDIERYNYGQSNVGSGLFNFDDGFTSSSQLGGTGGFGFASYLLGTTASGDIVLPAFTASQQIARALYLGDTWKVTKRLTLDLGLRYEQQGPWSERYNRLSVFDPTAPSSLQTPGLQLNGRFGLVDSSLNPSRNNIALNKTEFAPRVGFGLQITPNTVLRGGYGVFWVPNDADNSALPNNDSLNSVTTTMVATLNGGITPFNTLNNPFPNGVQTPVGRPNNPDQFCLNLGGCNAFLYSNTPGYMQQWNVDLQRELPGHLFVDAAYSASKGTHLPFGQFLNQLPDQALSLGNALLAQVPNPFYGEITSGPLSTATVAEGQLLRPFAQYNSLTIPNSGFGTSIYHSLQLKVQKHFSHGGTILGAYTWSKLISDVDDLTSWLEGPTGGIGGIQNWNDLHAARTLSSDDIPQRLVISYVLNIPIGHGYTVLGKANPIVDKLVSGWGVNGITTLQSGFPLKFSTSKNQTGSFGGGSKPNVVCADQSISGPAEAKLDGWFKTSCFQQPVPFTFGNEPRVDPHLRQDGMSNFDFAIFKNTGFGPEERYNVQFRTEFFNIFNTPQFGAPGTTVGTAQFGIVSSQVNTPRLIQLALRFTF